MVLCGYILEFRAKISVLVLFILLNMIFAIANPNDNQIHKEVAFYRIRSTSLVGNITFIKPVKREMDCALKCLRNYPQSCLSFNFGRDSIHKTFTCELSNSERILEPNRMQSRTGFDYLGVEKGVSKFIYFFFWLREFRRWNYPVCQGSSIIFKLRAQTFTWCRGSGQFYLDRTNVLRNSRR